LRLFSHSAKVNKLPEYLNLKLIPIGIYLNQRINKILVLSWRIIYIGQASDPTHDICLMDAEMEELQAG